MKFQKFLLINICIVNLNIYPALRTLINELSNPEFNIFQKRQILDSFVMQHPEYISTNQRGACAVNANYATLAHILIYRKLWKCLEHIMHHYHENCATSFFVLNNENLSRTSTAFELLCNLALEEINITTRTNAIQIIQQYSEKYPYLVYSNNPVFANSIINKALHSPISNQKAQYFLSIIIAYLPEAERIEYLNNLNHFYNSLIPNQSSRHVLTNPILNTWLCLCCYDQCFCCTNPEQPLPKQQHTAWWQEYYDKTFKSAITIAYQKTAPQIQIIMSPNSRLQLQTASMPTQCLCCQEQCYCCTDRNNQTNPHYSWWYNFYMTRRI